MMTLTALMIGAGVFWVLLPGSLLCLYRLLKAGPLTRDDYDGVCITTMIALCWTIAWIGVRSLAA